MTESSRREKDLPMTEKFEYVRGIDPNGRSVNVPKSLFGGNLDVASEEVLGGIKASPKSETDTNEVKIDPVTGKLYCPPSEVSMATSTALGGFVADVKTVEETEEVKIDPNTGKAYVKHSSPDEEDITAATVDDVRVLQFKDKKYNASLFSGLGRVYLRKNMVSGVNVLTQSMFTNDDGSVRSNTRYIIQYDYDLNGGIMTIPDGCVLEFQGGRISNGTIVFTNTRCITPCFSNCRFSGSTVDSFFNIEDYGSIKDNQTFDNAIVINDLINLVNTGSTSHKQKRIFIPHGMWNILSPIVIWANYERDIILEGCGYSSFIRQCSDNTYICKIYETCQIKNLSLHYLNKQPVGNTKSVAIAANRSVFSNFENLLIHNAYTAVGYIAIEDVDYGLSENQVYVNASFNNIRISRFSGYAFDFKKQNSNDGDSGSEYKNIYINTKHYLGNDDGTEGAISAIRGQSTVASFGMLNIEGGPYSSPLIDTLNYCKIAVDVLHIETPEKTPVILNAVNVSQIIVNTIDIQRAYLYATDYRAITTSGNSYVKVSNIIIRSDTTKRSGSTVFLCENLTNGVIIIDNMTDQADVVDKVYPIGSFLGIIHYNRYSFPIQYSSAYSNFKKDVFYQLLDRGNIVYKDNDGILRNPMGMRMLTTDNVIARLYGTTNQRPPLNEDHEGFEYYDSSLKKKILWIGTEWRNLNGTALE